MVGDVFDLQVEQWPLVMLHVDKILWSKGKWVVNFVFLVRKFISLLKVSDVGFLRNLHWYEEK